MDSFNWFVNEMLTKEAVRERLSGQHLELRELPEAQKRRKQNPITRALASSLVRLGLRLDPAAGEGLGALDLSLAPSEGRN